MAAYYNENDPNAAAWLRDLIGRGLLPTGEVDERSIVDVEPKDVAGFEQVHLFAGIGGWPYALRLAGVPDDARVWSGSCPCPPFSSAGRKKRCPSCGGKPIPHPRKTGIFACVPCGHEWEADKRHLWPEMLRLVSQCKPPVVFGEQVSGPDGRIWLAGVRATLEEIGYAVGAIDSCVASVGAPGARQRLYWVADTASGGLARRSGTRRQDGKEAANTCGMGNADGRGSSTRRPSAKSDRHGRSTVADGGVSRERERVNWLGDAGGQGLPTPEQQDVRAERRRKKRRATEQPSVPSTIRMGHADGGRCGQGDDEIETGNSETASDGPVGLGNTESGGCGVGGDASQPSGSDDAQFAGWSRFDVVYCRDGKARRVEPGSFPLAYGVPARVVRIRGYGNAINPQVAKEVIAAYLETLDEET